MRNPLFYDAIKIDGPKNKILEFNATDNFMDEKELKHFESLCNVLSDKSKYFTTKLNEYHDQLMTKLIQLPAARAFPCLDLYRIFLLHPDCTCHYKKYELGANHVYSLIGYLGDKNSQDPTKMLALRCLCNLFREQTSMYVLREKKDKVIEAVAACLANPKNTVREAAVTVLLNYSIMMLQKEDHQMRIQLLSAFGFYPEGLQSETDDQCKKRLMATVNNLCYKNYEAKKLAQSMKLLP